MRFCLVLDYHPDYVAVGGGSPWTHTTFKAKSWKAARKKAKRFIQGNFGNGRCGYPTTLRLMEVTKVEKIETPEVWFEYDPQYKGEKQMRTFNIKA